MCCATTYCVLYLARSDSIHVTIKYIIFYHKKYIILLCDIGIIILLLFIIYL